MLRLEGESSLGVCCPGCRRFVAYFTIVSTLLHVSAGALVRGPGLVEHAGQLCPCHLIQQLALVARATYIVSVDSRWTHNAAVKVLARRTEPGGWVFVFTTLCDALKLTRMASTAHTWRGSGLSNRATSRHLLPRAFRAVVGL